MRKWLLALLLAGTLHGAVLRGIVMENQTGHPLSRASILLEPVPGSAGKRMTTHSDRYGAFELAGMPAGVYLLQVSRIPFITVLYGQKRWNSAGKPLILNETETQFLTIRMLRFAAISGTVMDENDVGMPEFEVAAYLNTRPPQLVAKATADDEGRFRIFGLLPGTYIIRSASKQVEEAGYKPTYAKETESPDQAREVQVEIEEEMKQVNLHPLPGKLFSLSAQVTAEDLCCVPATMIFASEMGRQIIHSPGDTVARVFPGLIPGNYEVYGEAPHDPEGGGLQSGYQAISLGRDSSIFVSLHNMMPVRFTFSGISQKWVDDGTVKILARRKDLAGTYDQRTLTGSSVLLPAGAWEVAMSPLDGYYTASFSGSGPYRRNARPEGWNEITVTSYGGSARFGVSTAVSSVRGIVKDMGEPVSGAPVFLEQMDLDPEKRISFALMAITGVHGEYKFSSLSPGKYRVLSTFEYQMPDSKTMVNAGAREFTLDPKSEVTRDLDLYIIP